MTSGAVAPTRAAGASANEERPLRAFEIALTGIGFAGVLFALGKLRATGLQSTSTWGYDSGIFGTRFAIDLAILFAGVMIAQLVSARLAKLVFIAEGIACLVVAGPWFAGFCLAVLGAWFGVFASKLSSNAKIALAACIALAVPALSISRWNAAAYAFSMLFAFRLIQFAWEAWQNEFPKIEPERYFLYFLAPPLVVFPPYVTFIPRFAKHEATLSPRLTTTRVRRAAYHFALGFAFALLLWASPRLHIDPDDTALPSSIGRYLVQVTAIAQVVHVTFALLLLHGMDDRVPMNNPLFSRSFLEYWNRFQIHQKDFQVTLFYTPALMTLRKKNRYVAILAALAWTLVLWNTVMHVLARYVFVDRHEFWGLTLTALFVNVFNTVAIGGTLCLHEWRRRKKEPEPQGFVWNGLAWLATMIGAARIT